MRVSTSTSMTLGAALLAFVAFVPAATAADGHGQARRLLSGQGSAAALSAQPHRLRDSARAVDAHERARRLVAPSGGVDFGATGRGEGTPELELDIRDGQVSAQQLLSSGPHVF